MAVRKARVRGGAWLKGRRGERKEEGENRKGGKSCSSTVVVVVKYCSARGTLKTLPSVKKGGGEAKKKKSPFHPKKAIHLFRKHKNTTV